MENRRKRKRSRYAAELKAQILAECEVPSASLAKVAIAHSNNANIVDGWRKLAREAAIESVAGQFIPVAVAPTVSRVADERTIEVELGRSGITLKLSWPMSAAMDLSAWMRELLRRSALMIKTEAVWLAVEPLDMRSGTEAARARVATEFGAASSHHAYLFANRRANRKKVLVHDGIGVRLAARRLNRGRLVSPKDVSGALTPSRPQFDALVLGMPWQRIGEAGVITLLYHVHYGMCRWWARRTAGALMLSPPSSSPPCPHTLTPR